MNCRNCGLKFYSYRQFYENYAKWCEENKESLHFNAVIDQKMEMDFAGKTFRIVDPLTGAIMEIVVFVAVLPYSQYIYAEGMVSTKEPQWIVVNNNSYRPRKSTVSPAQRVAAESEEKALRPFHRLRAFLSWSWWGDSNT